MPILSYIHSFQFVKCSHSYINCISSSALSLDFVWKLSLNFVESHIFWNSSTFVQIVTSSHIYVSSLLLQQPCCKFPSMGDLAFCRSAPRLWSALPDGRRNALYLLQLQVPAQRTPFKISPSRSQRAVFSASPAALSTLLHLPFSLI